MMARMNEWNMDCMIEKKRINESMKEGTNDSLNQLVKD